MTDSARPESGAQARLTIGVFSDDGEFLRSARSRLSTVPQYDIYESPAASSLAAPREHGDLDLVLLDVGGGAVLQDSHLPEFRRAFGGIPFIIVSKELSPEHIRRVVQLSSTDWLRHPLETRDLLDAVAQQLKGVRIGKSDIYAFVPCSGGAGATSLAIAAAAHLAGPRGRRRRTGQVCLVDLDFSSGACGQYLDISNEFGIDGVINDPERIDLELLDIVKREHEAGFALLSFRRPDLAARGIPEDFVYRLLDVVSYRYARVVVDLPRHATPWSEQVLGGSDRILLVTELTVPGLRNARDMQQRLAELGKSDEDVAIVIDRERPRRLFSVGIKRKEVENVLKTDRIWTLPDDWYLMAEALNRGLPVGAVGPKSKLVKRMEALFSTVLTAAETARAGR
ncbi:MAG TPA: hypothetical protein VHG92_14350 [Afifellaceae bacterium]|nr:hypothetical protein [Afifellaceae bacterium]